MQFTVHWTNHKMSQQVVSGLVVSQSLCSPESQDLQRWMRLLKTLKDDKKFFLTLKFHLKSGEKLHVVH